MTPFVLAAMPALIDLVPKLGKLLASDSPTAQRNLALASAVAEVAKQAVGAANEQELVTRLEADPAARESARQAIEAAWFKLDEVGGGIAAAREANAAFGAPNAPRFWHQPVFWVTAALMPLVYYVVYAVLHESSRFTSEVQSMVISTILAGALGAVTGYWLGTSHSSQRKTELLNR